MGLIITLIVLVILTLLAMVKIVPEQEAWIIEQFGKYRKTLAAGLHLIVPFIQRASYKINLKEEVIDVAPQVCITNDNVQVTVDGILYLKVIDPEKAAYGIENYRFATSQLAQTTMRSEIGRIELDNTFSERDTINNAIVESVDEASDPWGIKVTRYEIKNLDPSDTVREAMEQQMTAEREKRADVLESDGYKMAEINSSKGVREESINLSKGVRQKRMNEAEGRGKSIEIEANAAAKGIKMIAEALQKPNADKAKTLRIVDQYVLQMGEIFGAADTTVLPAELSQIRSIIEGVAPGLKLGGDK